MSSFTRNYAIEPVYGWTHAAYSSRTDFDPSFVATRSLRKHADLLEHRGRPVSSWQEVPHKRHADDAMFVNPRSTDVLSK